MLMMDIKMFVVITMFEHQQNRHFRIPKHRNVFFEIIIRNTCPYRPSYDEERGVPPEVASFAHYGYQ